MKPPVSGEPSVFASSEQPSTLSRRTFLKHAAAAGILAGTSAISVPVFAKGGGALRIALFGGDFSNLSPLVRADIQSGILMHNMFDTLAVANYEGQTVVPFACQAWKNIDPLTWQIQLRQGMKWHKGYGEVTADDLVHTWQFHIDTKSFQMGSSLSALASVRKISTYVVEAKTVYPYAPFPGISMTYGGLMVSAKAHKEMGTRQYSATPIGNGPFMLESTNGSELTMVRHPEYWRPGLPKLDRLAYTSVPDSVTRVQAFQNNEFDFITHPDIQASHELKTSNDSVFRSTASWTWDYQQFNIVDHPTAPYHNKLVRQAIAYAVDRESIVNEIYYGEATATDNQIPPGFMGFRGSMLRYPKNGDLNKAAALMKQAGLSGYEVEVITSDKDWLRKELELVAAMVSQIGITFKIQDLDMGGYNNLWLNRHYEQLLEDISMNGPDPDATSWNFLNGNTSRGYANPTMTAMLIAARSEFDQAKRVDQYHKIVDMTLEECPMIFHCNPNLIQIYKKNVQGFSPSPQEEYERMDTVYLT